MRNYAFAAVSLAVSGGEMTLANGGGGALLRSTRHSPTSPGRPVPVTVDDDDAEPVWTDRVNGGVVTSDSDDVDDGKSSSLSSSVADPPVEYVPVQTRA